MQTRRAPAGERDRSSSTGAGRLACATPATSATESPWTDDAASWPVADAEQDGVAAGSEHIDAFAYKQPAVSILAATV
jgi:hypothetical protein